MRKLVWLAVVPTLVLLANAKRISHTTKRLDDKPRGEFISMGSMDEALQSTSKFLKLVTILIL